MWPWILIGGGLLLAVTSASSKPGTPLADAATAKKLGAANSRERRNARIIEQEVYAAGGDLRLAAAMIVNAWRESSLIETAIGDSGLAVGLFQIHPWGGSEADRRDPVKATKIMLSKEVFANTSHGRAFREVWHNPAADAATVAKAFTVHLERPADPEGQGNASAALVDQLWPFAP